MILENPLSAVQSPIYGIVSVRTLLQLQHNHLIHLKTNLINTGTSGNLELTRKQR